MIEESSRTTWWHYSTPKIWMIENLQGPFGDIILFQIFECLRMFKDHLVTLFYSKDLNDWESFKDHLVTLFYSKYLNDWESSRTTWWHYSTPKIWMIENLQGSFGDIILFQIFECLRIFKDHLVTLFYSKYLNVWESSRTTWWHYSIPKIRMIENLQGPLGDIILIPKSWMIENLQGPLGDIILLQRFEWLRILKDHLVTLFYSKYLNVRECSRTIWWHYSIPKIWMFENFQGPLGDIILFQIFEWLENLQGPLGDIILFQRFEWLRIFNDHLVTLFHSKDLNDWGSSRTTWVTLFYSKDLNDRESSRTTWWHYSIPNIWMFDNLQGPLSDIILFQRFEWSRIFKDHLVTLFYSKDLNDWESSRTTWWHYSTPKIWMIENLQGPLGDIILFQRFEWLRIFTDHLVTLFYSKYLNVWESSRTTWWHYSTPKIWMIENLQDSQSFKSLE